MPQLRQNVVTGDWVVIAPERSKRPTDFILAHTVKNDSKIGCPFCHDGNAFQVRLKGLDQRHVYVSPNKYPAFLENKSTCSTRSHHLEDGFYNTRPSVGGHDLLIINNHQQQLYDFNQETWIDLLSVAKKRYAYWRKDQCAVYSMLIYNQGVGAGASIHHPHAQIMASNIIPNYISKEVAGSERYFENNGSCVFCDLTSHEKTSKTRVIEETANFIAFTFYAARFPFEVWVLPKLHSAHFEDEKDEILPELSKVMRSVIAKIGKTLERPALNFFLHDLPTTLDRADYYHWHIEIAPRVSTYGGYELGSGTVIDVMAPEDAAEFLKNS